MSQERQLALVENLGDSEKLADIMPLLKQRLETLDQGEETATATIMDMAKAIIRKRQKQEARELAAQVREAARQEQQQITPAEQAAPLELEETTTRPEDIFEPEEQNEIIQELPAETETHVVATEELAVPVAETDDTVVQFDTAFGEQDQMEQDARNDLAAIHGTNMTDMVIDIPHEVNPLEEAA